MRNTLPDLILLDVMMPDMDGFEVLRMIREISNVPVIMLTAKGEEEDRVHGLELGADDYITKPFSPRELVARVRAILRRGKPVGAAAAVARVGPMVIDPDRHTVTVDGKHLDLTAKEFEILNTLAARPGMVFTREQLLEQVWGYSYFGDPRVVDVHMAKLRKKIEENPQNPRYLKTVRGVGYKLVDRE
jgi:DNA-binding response OmpR family regulator